ncbi:Glutathione S-transferase [Granulibacter bethesdensis CGDNIH4]|nr:Glutathione S-transferase [Granulibacter bethesdensis CGDNIH4]
MSDRQCATDRGRLPSMIELWTWPTPNGQKIHIALEEMGLPYRVIPVDIRKGDQFSSEFLSITPNHRIPAIIDPGGPDGQALTLWESGAILIYLAEKTGCLLPADPVGRLKAIQWLMFQMGGVGPMFGQWNHFSAYAPETIPYAVQRYQNEVLRLHRVLETRLKEADYLAGTEYSIADIATFPWITAITAKLSVLDDYPAVRRWHDRIASRDAVQRGMSVLQDRRQTTPITDAERDVLFGSGQTPSPVT